MESTFRRFKLQQLMQEITSEEPPALTRGLLWCGVASSAWYVAMNIYVPLQDSTYDWTSKTISEISAIGAPTRSLWVTLGWVYTLLLVLFGIGLVKAGQRWVGVVMLLQGAINPLWPPMHLRQVLSVGGGDIGDTLHIVFTMVWGLLSLLAIGFAAAYSNRGFRFFSLFTVALLLTFGFLTGQGAPRMEANLPTPWIGIWERICTGAYMLWVAVYALVLLRQSRRARN